MRASPHAQDVSPLGWTRLTGPEDFFLSVDWMAVVESTAGAPMRYLTAHRGGELVAGLATVLAGPTAPWTLGRPDTLLTHSAREGMTGAAELLADLPGEPADLLLPALVCGGRHLGRTRLLLGPHALRQDAVALIVRAEAVAREYGARSVCFPYLDETDAVVRAVLAERGYTHHTSGEFASLAVPPGGFGGYLDSLSAHRARRVRAERRAVAAAGIECVIEPLATGDVDRLAALETELFAKYGMPDWDPRRSADILLTAAAVLGDRALVSLARQDGDIIGFGLLLTHGDQWFAHRAGFDYVRQGRLPLYYETLYYRPVELAARHGVTAIHYGIGSTEAKRSRGCVTHTQYSHLKRMP